MVKCFLPFSIPLMLKASIHRTRNCPYFKLLVYIIRKQTRKTRFAHGKNRSVDIAVSVLKNNDRRGGRAREREHEIVPLLASYIFIQDLPGNSTDYKLNVRRLPLCSWFVFPHNVDLLFSSPCKPVLLKKLDQIGLVILRGATEIPAERSMKHCLATPKSSFAPTWL